MARIMRAGVKYQKNFSRKQYGGWPKATKAAKEWVAEKKKELPSLEETTRDILSSRNSSGVVGVHLNRNYIKRPKGFEYEYWKWVAKWPNCPIRGGVQWTISDKRPDEDAFTLAVLTRRMKTKDRKKVEAEFERIRGTKEHKDILACKMLSFA